MGQRPQTPYTPDVDPLEALLRRSALNDRQRAGVWDVYEAAVNTDDLAARLESIQIPEGVKSQLWTLKAQETAPVPKEATQQGPEGSSLGRFASGVGEMLNPLTMAEGLYNTVRHPIDTATGIYNAQKGQYDQAKAAEAEGRTSEMVGHSLAAAIPILGPLAAGAGEQIGSGDWAGGLGKATGIIAPAIALGAMRGGAKNPAILEREAVEQVGKRVLSPANPRYKKPAYDIAPELLKRGVSGNRGELQQYATELIADASQKIDDVAASYPPTARLQTGPIVQNLDDLIQSMHFGGQANPALTGTIAELTKMRDFVKGQGVSMAFEDMRRLRQQLDDISAKAGAFSRARGDMSLSAVEEAATETGHSLRRQIATERPELGPANADMHLGITLRDILDPAKGRPTTQVAQTGVTGGLSTAGAIMGSGLSNIPGLKAIGAFVASDLLPRIRNAQLSPENQMRLARDKFRLAEALRAGKVRPAQRIIQEIGAYLPGTATTAQASPSRTP